LLVRDVCFFFFQSTAPMSYILDHSCLKTSFISRCSIVQNKCAPQPLSFPGGWE
jgi:hypothetical protein